MTYTAIVPMKAWDQAKSRLHADPHVRRTLAEAFARDTLAAVLACPEVSDVVVVTQGDLVVDHVRAAGAHVIQEPGDRSLDTLGSAIRHGIAWAGEHRPDVPVAVVPSDLPALTPDALGELLREAATHPFAFVADANGDGTTILTSRSPELMRPGYGPGSAERHRGLGAYELVAPGALRQDVDVLIDLAAAERLSLGPHTRQAYADLTADEASALSR
ncbi:2-phospho-L-lactate guanylyltransferase [Aeromicrobium ginsengisoli]|uniref:Phosphoenolpyruvate guanylyltransferase n=1 Tax=Aeromicrobium ginsengisoli TaxID=363867 RepID=A0A5M4F9Q4_9ACTN|nr:2-phospho-L-lactate guanylyltransferase [Aeromicrobium ginsengisoli]KAA1394423.1 2-phospho-L-lactate guanylyltransferase [Aeromicrobium ginsengisoli]